MHAVLGRPGVAVCRDNHWRLCLRQCTFVVVGLAIAAMWAAVASAI